MNKLVEPSSLKGLFRDGMTLMIGGFMTCGTPEGLVDLLIEWGLRDLTVICNDTGFADKGIGRLVTAGILSKVIASHIGTNPETGRLMNEGKLLVELYPQGTLIEKIRAAGAGLGGILTPTGVGTLVEEGKQKLSINGRDYLLELPIRADIALIRGSVADESGNTIYRGTTANFNPMMALAADTVILEAQEIVKIGQLEPERVITPGVLVNYIVKGGDGE